MAQEPQSIQVVAVVGPTATGKSDLAIELARYFDGEVVNADSMQVYQGMDIGTAKVPVSQRRVPHHLLDIWPISTVASVSDYQALARAAIADIASRGKVPVVVGGSGLYVAAVIDDLRFPGTDSQVRQRWQDELDRIGSAALHQQLAELDPTSAAAILSGNGRRIVRALEVIELTGGPYAAYLPTGIPYYSSVQIGLACRREQLDRRIGDRVDRMWELGLVDEVRDLANGGLRQAPTASRALGYAQVLGMLAGETDEEFARCDTVRATRKFARRQEAWLRRDQRIRWIDANLSPGGNGSSRSFSAALAACGDETSHTRTQTAYP